MHTTLAHCIKWHTAHTRMFVMHTMMHLAIAHYWTHHTWHTQKFVMHTRLLLSVGFNARLTAAPLCTKALFHTFNQNFSYNDQNFSYNNQNFSYLEPKLFIQQPKLKLLFRCHAFCHNSISLSSLSWLWYWRWQLGDVSFIGWCIVCFCVDVYFLMMRTAKPLLCSELVRSPIKWSDHWKTLQLLPKTFRGTTICQMELFCMAWEIILSSQTVLLANWDAQ